MSNKKHKIRKSPYNREKLSKKKWILLLIMGFSIIYVNPSILFNTIPSSASSPVWPSSWTLIVSDPDEGYTSGVEILKVEYAEDATHYFFRITTESNVATNYNFGVLINDGSNDTNWDGAVGSYNSAGWSGGTYSWNGTQWITIELDGTHIRVNSGISGVELAAQRSTFPFSIDINSTYFKVVSTSSYPRAFHNSLYWQDQRNPTNSVDDQTVTTLMYSGPNDITINGNADFINQAFIRGWPGSGSSNDPIIIENFTINTGPKNGFSIGNTTLHFIVRNVIVENMASGFYLENVSNGYLENNTANNNNWAGIRLYNSSNNYLINNIANSNVDYGIFLQTSSDYNTLTGNTLNSNFQGIRVNTKYNTVSNNTARFNSNDGIYLGMAARNNTISNNSAHFNSRDGIYMYSSDYNNISSNTMNNNSRYGIYLEVSNNNEFQFNLIKDNLDYGFWVNGGSNTISLNNFIGNRQGNSPQTFDSGANNLFLKNFWADWVNQSDDTDCDGFLDDAYQIGGSANNNDPQPLFQAYQKLRSIAINGNCEFKRYAGTNGWPGTGSENDPYIIKNYQFDLGDLQPGVSIGNTTFHFIMSNVHVNNYESGFYLENVTNGQFIQNSASSNLESGFQIENSWFLTFIDNLAWNNSLHGFEVYLSHYCDIKENNITQNSEHGLYVENSIGTNIELNNVSLNGQNGIYIY
ncbi:MAG: right-handed parallel beta-helix repeat-containing protein, partial [Candidatus Hodarchaeales archaeon]